MKRDLFTSTGKKELSFIPESDVYRLVMRSKLPGAERFQDWVVEKVLPTIRKTGRFEITLAVHAVPQTYLEALRAHLASEGKVVEQAKLIEEPNPLYPRTSGGAGAEGMKKGIHQFKRDSVVPFPMQA